jgi:hypothetical protein
MVVRLIEANLRLRTMMLIEVGIQECNAYEIISHIIKSLLSADNSNHLLYTNTFYTFR